MAQRENSEAKAVLEATPEPEHSGLQLYVRFAVLAVLSIVVVLGFVLAVETFVALNNGRSASRRSSRGSSPAGWRC